MKFKTIISLVISANVIAGPTLDQILQDPKAMEMVSQDYIIASSWYPVKKDGFFSKSDQDEMIKKSKNEVLEMYGFFKENSPSVQGAMQSMSMEDKDVCVKWKVLKTTEKYNSLHLDKKNDVVLSSDISAMAAGLGLAGAGFLGGGGAAAGAAAAANVIATILGGGASAGASAGGMIGAGAGALGGAIGGLGGFARAKNVYSNQTRTQKDSVSYYYVKPGVQCVKYAPYTRAVIRFTPKINHLDPQLSARIIKESVEDKRAQILLALKLSSYSINKIIKNPFIKNVKDLQDLFQGWPQAVSLQDRELIDANTLRTLMDSFRATISSVLKESTSEFERYKSSSKDLGLNAQTSEIENELISLKKILSSLEEETLAVRVVSSEDSNKGFIGFNGDDSSIFILLDRYDIESFVGPNLAQENQKTIKNMSLLNNWNWFDSIVGLDKDELTFEHFKKIIGSYSSEPTPNLKSIVTKINMATWISQKRSDLIQLAKANGSYFTKEFQAPVYLVHFYDLDESTGWHLKLKEFFDLAESYYKKGNIIVGVQLSKDDGVSQFECVKINKE